jgi:branched-chain amino acid transport system permease protein
MERAAPRKIALPGPDRAIPSLLLLGLLLLPFLARSSGYVLQVFTHALLLATLALSWNILGTGGSISLGHAAFFGVGAYSSGLLSLKPGLSPWLTIPVGGLVGTGLAVVMGLLFRRLRGAYFALATLAFVEIPRVVTDNWEGLTRGPLGLVGLPGLPALTLGPWRVEIGSSAAASYYLVLSYALVVVFFVALLWRSNLGLALQAAREEETAARAVGIHVDRYRFLSLLLSAFLTATSGAIYVHLTRYTVPGLVYSLHFSAIPLIFAMCGGRFTILGPALAALVLYPVDQFLFHPLLPAGHEFLYGLFLILVVLFMPGGFWGGLRRSP